MVRRRYAFAGQEAHGIRLASSVATGDRSNHTRADWHASWWVLKVRCDH